MKQDIKYEFKVWYRQNPHYKGTFNAAIKPGLSGTFDTMADALKGEAACKKWFNEEKINNPKSINGQMVDDITVTVHDTVVTTIEEYQDGELVDMAEAGSKVA